MAETPADPGKYKIRTYNTIAPRGLERFAYDRYEVSSEIADPHAVLLRSQRLPISPPACGR